MKLLSLSILTALSALFTQTAIAQTIENRFFKVDLLNESSWGRDEQTVQEIRRITKQSIDYWANLLVNNDTFIEGNKITVSLEFMVMNNTTVAYAQPHLLGVGNRTLESNGQQFNIATGAQAKLLYKYGTSETDIQIKVNNQYTFYFDEDPAAAVGYDFHTVLLHELTHGMGFVSRQYTIDSDKQLQQEDNFVLPYDTLITESLNGESFVLGDTITLGTDGPAIFNPSEGSGSSITHLADSYKDALMQRAFSSGQVIRELTSVDIGVFNSMGFNIAPEPSTAVLVLMLTPACLLRRRRQAA